VVPRALLWREHDLRPVAGLTPAGAFTMGATSAAALPRQLSRFVIADYAGACGGTWLRQIYGPASPCRGLDGRSPLQGDRSP